MLKKKISLCSIILLVVALSMIMTGCQESKQVNADNDKTFPKDIKELCFSQGNVNADTVIVNTQGGPDPELCIDEFKWIMGEIKKDDVLMLDVHQVQTKNPERFLGERITLEEAIEYDQESIEYLYKVIKHFKDQGKKVYVIGASYGSFMTQELIADKGIDLADGYIIAVGRLDMNEEAWKTWREGQDGSFTNGVNFVSKELDIPPDIDPILFKNMGMLLAGLTHNRYTEKLKNVDLSKVTYIYGKTDEAVGRLTDQEVEFLKSRNATIIADEGGHDEGYDQILGAIKSSFGIE